MTQRTRKLSGWVRWLHTYLSLFAFAALIFFSITGFTANHGEWFEEGTKESEIGGTIEDKGEMIRDVHARRMYIVSSLCERHALRGSPTVIDADEGTWEFSMKGPGYRADVIVDDVENSYTIFESKSSTGGYLNDLHKGRHASSTWRFFLDVTAWGLTLVGLTGLWLLWYLKKIRMVGAITTLVGIAALVFLMFEAS